MSFTNSRCVYLLVAFLSSLTTFRLAICHSYNAFNPPLLITVSLSSSSPQKNALFISWHWYRRYYWPLYRNGRITTTFIPNGSNTITSNITSRRNNASHILLRALKIHPHGSFARTSHTRRNSRPAGPFSPIHSCIVVSYRRSKCLENWTISAPGLSSGRQARCSLPQHLGSLFYRLYLPIICSYFHHLWSLASQSYPRLASKNCLYSSSLTNPRPGSASLPNSLCVPSPIIGGSDIGLAKKVPAWLGARYLLDHILLNYNCNWIVFVLKLSKPIIRLLGTIFMNFSSLNHVYFSSTIFLSRVSTRLPSFPYFSHDSQRRRSLDTSHLWGICALDAWFVCKRREYLDVRILWVVQILRLIHSRSIAIFEIVGTRVDPPTPQFLRPSSIRRNLRLTAEFLNNLSLSLGRKNPHRTSNIARTCRTWRSFCQRTQFLSKPLAIGFFVATIQVFGVNIVTSVVAKTSFSVKYKWLHSVGKVPV